MYRGTFLQGDAILLGLRSLDTSGAPTLPDEAPTVRFFAASDRSEVGNGVQLPIHDRYALDSDGLLNAYFQRRMLLGEDFDAGWYIALYTWTISEQDYHRCEMFRVVAGGPEGAITGLFAVSRPDGRSAHLDTEAGNVLLGRNPQ